MSDINKVRIFVGNNDKITRYENNLVTLTLENGEIFEKLEPRRLFPISRVDQYIILIDEDGKEAAIIRNFQSIDKESAKIVQESIDDYYLVPNILRIYSVVEKSGTLVWETETNRGSKRIEIRDRNHDIKVYKDGRLRIRDADDNRYIIEDYQKLDKHSKYLLTSDL
ncbi:MAG: DUF1854 domain-containing protein [Acutalibacteraceae bacterium]|jgi:hypothetical protein|nr:DUF1854 domain-containing protein [Acutalibacteraceae bacterium]MEE1048841.1 DUF1854 domain-containing protein [Clostridia bacterium]